MVEIFNFNSIQQDIVKHQVITMMKEKQDQSIKKNLWKCLMNRSSLANGYPVEQQKIAECNKKISVLNNLREQYDNSSMNQPSSFGSRH